MDQDEVNATNQALMERFFERLPPGELIAGIATTKADDPAAVVWYPVDPKDARRIVETILRSMAAAAINPKNWLWKNELGS